MTRDEQTTKPQAKRIKYAPPMLRTLDAPDGKGLCTSGSGDSGLCSHGYSAGPCTTNGSSAYEQCVAGPGYT